MKLLILKGLPGSGKTTWAREFVKTNKDWVRINRDDLRNMRGEYWVPKQERIITDWEDNCIRGSLRHGHNVILDATNLNQDRNKARVDGLKAGFPELKVEYKFFNVPVEECIKRDLIRPNSVGEKVIWGMYNKYLKPAQVVYTEVIDLPRAVIFDLDGTLAKMNGRSPYEWDKVDTDKPNIAVIEALEIYENNGCNVIIVSGRDGSCREKTNEWLSKNVAPPYRLYMRPEGNMEKDSIIKKRIFEEQIRGKYYVEAVFDDRDQTVRMWREELGLPCFQVDYGNF